MSSLTESIFGSIIEPKTASSSLFEETIEIPTNHRSAKRKENTNDKTTPTTTTIESTTTTDATTTSRKRKKAKDSKEETDKETGDATHDDDYENNNIDDDDDVNKRTIFVGNLPLSTTRKSLAKLFADCGKIVSTRIRNVAAAGIKLPPEHAGKQNLVKKISSNTKNLDTNAKQNVAGYVVFEDPSSVELALQKNHSMILDDDNNKERHIRVDRVQPTHDASRSVFVGNLPYHADEESLEAHFLTTVEAGSIENVRIIRDKETHQCKGFGYVLFTNASQVAQALRYLDGSNYMKREIRVRVCGKRYKNQHGSTTTTKKEKKKRQILDNTVGALQRVLLKSHKMSNSNTSKKRMRGPPTSSSKKVASTPNTSGISKRAAKHAKQTKRTKKLEKRITQGMGKSRKG